MRNVIIKYNSAEWRRMKMSKLIVIVQCELVTRRCSGYNCMKAFTQRSGKMEGYPEGTRCMAINCGGCCGAGIDVKIENLEKRMLANDEKKEDVVIHLSTCICTENHHRLPCPFKNYLKQTIERRGFTVIEGTYLSKTASRKRAEGSYRPFE